MEAYAEAEADKEAPLSFSQGDSLAFTANLTVEKRRLFEMNNDIYMCWGECQ
jgi:hypothetical protein